MRRAARLGSDEPRAGPGRRRRSPARGPGPRWPAAPPATAWSKPVHRGARSGRRRPRPAPPPGPRPLAIWAQKAGGPGAERWWRVTSTTAAATSTSATTASRRRSRIRTRWRASASLWSVRLRHAPRRAPVHARGHDGESMSDRGRRDADPRPGGSGRAAAAVARSSPTAWSRPGRVGEQRRAGHQHVGAGRDRAGHGGRWRCRRRPRCRRRAPRSSIRPAQLGDLGLHGGEVALAAEARVHRHDQHHVDQVEHVGHVRRSGWPG